MGEAGGSAGVAGVAAGAQLLRWGAGDPGSPWAPPLTSGSGKQPPGQGVPRVSKDVLLPLPRGRHGGGWGGVPGGLFISETFDSGCRV